MSTPYIEPRPFEMSGRSLEHGPLDAEQLVDLIQKLKSWFGETERQRAACLEREIEALRRENSLLKAELQRTEGGHNLSTG